MCALVFVPYLFHYSLVVGGRGPVREHGQSTASGGRSDSAGGDHSTGSSDNHV